MLKSRLFRMKLSLVSLLCLAGAIVLLSHNIPSASAETAIFSLNVTDTVLEMTLSTNNLIIELAPTNSTPDTEFGSITVNVGTNNANGYNLSMSGGGSIYRVERIEEDIPLPSIGSIPYISGGYSASAFASSNDTTNKWGYSIGNGNFFPLAADTPIESYNSAINSRASVVNFGAKVDYSQAAGMYQGSIAFSAVANPPEIYYMQDVATWENIVGDDIDGLDVIDSRTGYSYTITEKDGLLVMTDDLKVPAGTQLTTADSDVSASFTLPTEEWTSSDQDYYCKPIMKVVDGVYYYNWYAATANSTSCANPTSSTNATASNDASSLGSICPKGWTLPTQQNATIFTGSDYEVNWYFPDTGYVVSGAYTDGRNNTMGSTDIGKGYYWLSTRASNEGAYSTLFQVYYYGGTQNVSTASSNKYVGAKVRCVRAHQDAIAFKAGDGIEAIMVADGSNKFAPAYATPGSPLVITNPGEGTKFIVTVIPRQGYILDAWEGDYDLLDSDTLLTTYFTSPALDEPAVLEAVGTAGHYDYMHETTTCSTATNLTDIRDGKSYAVKNLNTYCYMLSNLRLDPGITLTSTNSDITPNNTYQSFTTPIEAWTSSSQNYYCKAIMKKINNEYYYNWYAAMANPYVCDNPTASTNATSENDAKSLGSICPNGWTLPRYTTQGIGVGHLWNSNSNTNTGMIATTGYSHSGSQYAVGNFGDWWSNLRYDSNDTESYNVTFTGGSIARNINTKYYGFSVRCVLK